MTASSKDPGEPDGDAGFAAALLADQSRAIGHIARGATVDDTVRDLDQLVTRWFSDGRLLVSYDDGDLGSVGHAPGLDDDLVTSLTESTMDLAGRPPSSGRLAEFSRDPVWDGVVSAVSGGRFTVAWVTDLPRSSSAPDIRVALLRKHDVPLTDDQRALLGQVCDLMTIAVERDHLQNRLAHDALHDAATGLPNRRKLVDRLGEAFSHDGAVGGVIYIDLDGIKLINESLGRGAGDHLLQEVARRFVAAVRAVDFVARVGGDEFVVHCPDLETLEGVARVAERITESIREPIELSSGRVVVSGSIGVVQVTGRTDVSSVLQDADLAMNEAKRTGRNRIALFHPGLRDRATDRMEVEKALLKAVDAQEMELHFQPIVRLSDGAMVAVESLLRWHRPGVGVVGPETFLPVATEMGLMLSLGRWVIDQAVAAVSRWPELAIAVNLSARQLADVDLVSFVRDTLDHHDVAARRLCLEVTETDLIADAEMVVTQLAEFRRLGVRLAIDDFGTGFATFDYLRRFSAADALKIDGSFVAGVADPSSPDLAIVSAALVLADDLGFETIAEGVETEAQREVLVALGCGFAQGYLFSHPVTADEIDVLRAVDS